MILIIIITPRIKTKNNNAQIILFSTSTKSKEILSPEHLVVEVYFKSINPYNKSFISSPMSISFNLMAA
jgi:hypothetical protein